VRGPAHARSGYRVAVASPPRRAIGARRSRRRRWPPRRGRRREHHGSVGDPYPVGRTARAPTAARGAVASGRRHCRWSAGGVFTPWRSGRGLAAAAPHRESAAHRGGPLITALLRRLRFSAGSLALLAVLAFVATALMVAAPRLANHYADAGLQGRIASASHFTRDLIFGARPDPSQPNPQPSEVPSAASLLEHRMRPELQAAIGQRWTAMQIGPALAIGDLGGGFPLELGLRWQSDAVDLVDVVEGRWPHTHVSGDAPIEAAMSEDVAEGLELEVGDTFTAAAGDGAHVVRIVGIFRPRDPVDPAWDSEPLVLKPFMPIGEDNVPWRGVLLTEADAITTAAKAELPVMYTWRFRLDEKAVTTANLDQIISDVIGARQTAAAAAGIPGVSLLTGLDVLLSRFEAELRSVSAILAVVQAGVLATIFGLALLA